MMRSALLATLRESLVASPCRRVRNVDDIGRLRAEREGEFGGEAARRELGFDRPVVDAFLLKFRVVAVPPLTTEDGHLVGGLREQVDQPGSPTDRGGVARMQGVHRDERDTHTRVLSTGE